MSNPRYPEEFKIQAPNQVAEKKLPVADVAARLGVSTHSLYAWIKRYSKSQEERQQHAELRRLRCFEALRLQPLEPKAKAVALPIQNLHSVSRFVEEHEKHRIEHRDLDVQFDQRSEAINGFSEVGGLGVEIDFFDFGVGTHHEVRAPESNREHSIGDQMAALNVGFMERLHRIYVTYTVPIF